MWLDSLGNLVVGALMLLAVPIAAYVAFGYARRHVRRLDGRAGERPGVDPAELDGLRERVTELEERLDFTERLLAQERARLPGARD